MADTETDDMPITPLTKEEVEEALHDLETWGDAYPLDIFPEPTREQKDAMLAVTSPADGVARVAASMARHLYRVRGPKLASLIRTLSARAVTARADALEEAAKVVEGETYEQIYVMWPQWSALGNRGRESTEAKLTARLAASIRSLTAPAVEKPGKYPRIEARPFNDPPITPPTVEKE